MIEAGKFLKQKFSRKNKTQEEAEKAAAEQYKNDVSFFIGFILKEDKENNIILGKRKDQYFICFKNEYFAPFFSDWYALMKDLISKRLSQSTYDLSFEALCSKYSAAADKTQKSDDTDTGKMPAETVTEKVNNETNNNKISG
ncbi:MAG: hypothetical protein LUC97_05475 [Clostridiales bacterium]|nr:hypothetical protein [Clostridiales bacterium]